MRHHHTDHHRPSTAAQTPTDPATRRFQCRHIFTDGHRCGSPCLRGEDLCFYHLGTRRARPVPTVDLSQGEHQRAPFTLPSPEDRSGIQAAIGEILNRLASNELDPRRAGLMLYGLQIASLNLPRAIAQLATEPSAIVEDVVTDPDLGPLAPRAEVAEPKAEDRPFSLARLLQAEWLRTQHEAAQGSQPDTRQTPDGETPPTDDEGREPATLPTLEASATAPSHHHPQTVHGPVILSAAKGSPHGPLPLPVPLACHSAAKRRNLPLPVILRRRRRIRFTNP